MVRRVMAQMSGRLVVTNAVFQELVDRSQDGSNPSLQEAALTVLSRGPSLFTHDQTIYPRRRLAAVLQEVKEQDAKRPNGHLGGHAGEVEAILYAEGRGAIVLSNDISARKVAENHHLEVASFATVLAVEVQEGRMDGAEASQMCAKFDAISWPGERYTSPLAFASMHVPPGFTL